MSRRQTSPSGSKKLLDRSKTSPRPTHVVQPKALTDCLSIGGRNCEAAELNVTEITVSPAGFHVSMNVKTSMFERPDSLFP